MCNHQEPIEQTLRRLIEEVRQYPPNRARRRIAMTKLIMAIKSAPNLSRQRRWSSQPYYLDCYGEALNKALREFCRKIDNDPNFPRHDYPVMQQFNRLFTSRMSDCCRSCNTPQPPEEIIDPIKDDDRIDILNLIDEDPEGFFQNTRMPNSDVNLQRILLLLFQGYTWQEISARLGVPIPTLSSFYQRKLTPTIYYIRNHLGIVNNWNLIIEDLLLRRRVPAEKLQLLILKIVITIDPEGFLHGLIVENNFYGNARKILLLILDDRNFAYINTTLNVSTQQIVSLFRQNIDNIIAYFKQYILRLQEIITHDPEGLLHSLTIPNHPDANAKMILLLTLNGKNLVEIIRLLVVSQSEILNLFTQNIDNIIVYITRYI